MYQSHFGLRQRPFRSSPDPAAYYPANAHEEVLQQLWQAISDDEQLAVLVGAPGTGKTLLATLMLDRLSDRFSCVFLTNGHMERRVDLFQAVLYDLGLPYEGKSEQELRLSLSDRLLTDFAEGKRTILLIDEAQHLSTDLLEELRLLGNLESPKGRAIQIVLVGQSTILETLRRPEMRMLAQRIVVRVELGQLTLAESADYVLHHLRLAGARPEALIDEEALAVLARGSNGVPRLLNQAAHLALALTCEAGAGRLEAEGVLEAFGRLGVDLPEIDDEAAEGNPRIISGPASETEVHWPPPGYLLPGTLRGTDFGARNGE